MDSKKINDKNDEDNTIVVNAKGNSSQHESTDGNNSDELIPDSGAAGEMKEKADPPVNKISPAKDEKKYSAGTLTAGMAGAGLAGVVAGTIFSDDIKDMINADIFNPEDPMDVENVQEIIPLSADESVHIHASIINDLVEDPGGASSMEFSMSDGSGNSYNVSFFDFNSESSIEIHEPNIQFVDGVSVNFTQYGDALPDMFINQVEWASPMDYQMTDVYVDIDVDFRIDTPMPDVSLYEIQSGDTLSEIAEAHHTTIEHLMELNPEITDPDLIYAKDHLIIPENDNFSNPYETGLDYGSDGHLHSGLEISVDLSEVGSDSSIPSDLDSLYENIPNLETEYDLLIEQTDFDSFEIPDSYIDISVF